jgi:hypothetical protein
VLMVKRVKAPAPHRTQMTATVQMPTQLWKNLPDDLIWAIRGQRSQLLRDEYADLEMTHKYGACYCCGGWADADGTNWWDDSAYTFCGTCDQGQFKDMDMDTRVMYCNAWSGNDSERWSRMYHTAIAPEVDDHKWDDFWEDRFEGMKPPAVRQAFDIWEVRMQEAHPLPG